MRACKASHIYIYVKFKFLINFFAPNVFPNISFGLEMSNHTILVLSYTFVLVSVADLLPNLPSVLLVLCSSSLFTGTSYVLSFLPTARVNKASSFGLLPCLPLGNDKLK